MAASSTPSNPVLTPTFGRALRFPLDTSNNVVFQLESPAPFNPAKPGPSSPSAIVCAAPRFPSDIPIEETLPFYLSDVDKPIGTTGKAARFPQGKRFADPSTEGSTDYVSADAWRALLEHSQSTVIGPPSTKHSAGRPVGPPPAETPGPGPDLAAPWVAPCGRNGTFGLATRKTQGPSRTYCPPPPRKGQNNVVPLGRLPLELSDIESIFTPPELPAPPTLKGRAPTIKGASSRSSVAKDDGPGFARSVPHGGVPTLSRAPAYSFTTAERRGRAPRGATLPGPGQYTTELRKRPTHHVVSYVPRRVKDPHDEPILSLQARQEQMLGLVQRTGGDMLQVSALQRELELQQLPPVGDAKSYLQRQVWH